MDFTTNASGSGVAVGVAVATGVDVAVGVAVGPPSNTIGSRAFFPESGLGMGVATIPDPSTEENKADNNSINRMNNTAYRGPTKIKGNLFFFFLFITAPLQERVFLPGLNRLNGRRAKTAQR